MEIEEARKEIDLIDSELVKLFEKRMKLSAEIAKEKSRKNIPVYDKKREQEILKKINGKSTKEMQKFSAELYEKIFELSRNYQKELMK